MPSKVRRRASLALRGDNPPVNSASDTLAVGHILYYPAKAAADAVVNRTQAQPSKFKGM
jgi:hypothetical protein